MKHNKKHSHLNTGNYKCKGFSPFCGIFTTERTFFTFLESLHCLSENTNPSLKAYYYFAKWYQPTTFYSLPLGKSSHYSNSYNQFWQIKFFSFCFIRSKTHRRVHFNTEHIKFINPLRFNIKWKQVSGSNTIRFFLSLSQ